MVSVKTKIVRIGDPQGVRIPKAFWERCYLQGEKGFEPRGDYLILR